jgi:hypothetical protein
MVIGSGSSDKSSALWFSLAVHCIDGGHLYRPARLSRTFSRGTYHAF